MKNIKFYDTIFYMKMTFDSKLYDLAIKIRDNYGVSLYAVGGLVRNFVISGKMLGDIDICSPLSSSRFSALAKEIGFSVLAEYHRTSTVKLRANGIDYEFTSFRVDSYLKGGAHTPENAEFTDNISDDAKRRDFKCNSVYYDILSEEFVDPLNGIQNVKDKVLDTVTDGEEVFSHDGLRLMRLARFVGELGFTPTNKTLVCAKNNAENIDDISSERIYEELKKILISDGVYGFSKKEGHISAIKVLDEIGVLKRIIPELYNLRVLEKTFYVLKTVRKELRLYALLILTPNPEEILNRLKAPKKVVKKMKEYCLGLQFIKSLNATDETETRKFIVKNYDNLDEIFSFYGLSADGDKGEENQKIEVIEKTKKTMENDGTPFSIKELKITPNDLLTMGIKGNNIGKTLERLFWQAVISPENNKHEILVKMTGLNKSKDVDK